MPLEPTLPNGLAGAMAQRKPSENDIPANPRQRGTWASFIIVVAAKQVAIYAQSNPFSTLAHVLTFGHVPATSAHRHLSRLSRWHQHLQEVLVVVLMHSRRLLLSCSEPARTDKRPSRRPCSPRKLGQNRARANTAAPRILIPHRRSAQRRSLRRRPVLISHPCYSPPPPFRTSRQRARCRASAGSRRSRARAVRAV